MAFSGVRCKVREREKIRRKGGSGRKFALIPHPTPPLLFSCSYLFGSSLIQINKIITVEDAFGKPEFFQAFSFCNCISCIFNCNDLLYIDIYCELGMANCPESGSMHSSSD